MSRIRSIKPEWLEDERLITAGSDARVASIALIILADDYGRGRLTVATAARIFPETPENFREAFARLSGWFVEEYHVRGQGYFRIVNWDKHQKVDKPGKPHVPPPETACIPTAENPPETPENFREALATDLRTVGPKDPDRDPDPSRVAAPERGTPMDPLKPQRGILLRAHRRRYSEATGHDVPPGKNSAADIAEVVPWLVGYAQKTGQSFEQAAEAVLERWWKDPYAAGKGWPLWHLAKHVDEFAEALPVRLTVVKAASGMVPVSSREEHAADAAEGTQF